MSNQERVLIGLAVEVVASLQSRSSATAVPAPRQNRRRKDTVGFSAPSVGRVPHISISAARAWEGIRK